MMVLTGYVWEVRDRDDGVPEIVLDVGGDVMVSITHLPREQVDRIAQHLSTQDLVTITWCGSGLTIAEVV